MPILTRRGTNGKPPPPPPRVLSADHVAELAASGVNPDYALTAGVYTEDDPAEVARLLGWDRPAVSLGPCLVFPYLDPDGRKYTYPDRDGRETDYTRLKPTRPRQDAKGKPVKYEAPRRQPPRPYIPPHTGAALADPAADLLVTEGEKKALSADAHGFPCLGLSGVDSWRAGGRLLPELEAVAWRGRRVYVVYDSDMATKPQVRRAERELAAALTRRGADVRLARFPEGGAA